MCSGMDMLKPRAALFTTLTTKYMTTMTAHDLMGTLGFTVPHFVVKMKPWMVMNRKEENVTRLPTPGSCLVEKRVAKLTGQCMSWLLLDEKLEKDDVEGAEGDHGEDDQRDQHLGGDECELAR